MTSFKAKYNFVERCPWHLLAVRLCSVLEHAGKTGMHNVPTAAILPLRTLSARKDSTWQCLHYESTTHLGAKGQRGSDHAAGIIFAVCAPHSFPMSSPGCSSWGFRLNPTSPLHGQVWTLPQNLRVCKQRHAIYRGSGVAMRMRRKIPSPRALSEMVCRVASLRACR